MKFSGVKRAWEELDELLFVTTSKRLFDQLTVPQPSGPEDELHFLHLVNWCYVAINEAGQVVLKHLIGMLRNSDAQASASVGKARSDIGNLRTAFAHNLPPSSDQTRKRSADVWITQNGGSPPDWSKCCDALCSQMENLLRSSEKVWRLATELEEDRGSAVAGVLGAVDRSWQAYLFDEMVVEAAEALSIRGLNVVAYRDAHLARWKELAGFFDDRELAKVHVRVAIRNGLALTFAPTLAR